VVSGGVSSGVVVAGVDVVVVVSGSVVSGVVSGVVVSGVVEPGVVEPGVVVSGVVEPGVVVEVVEVVDACFGVEPGVVGLGVVGVVGVGVIAPGQPEAALAARPNPTMARLAATSAITTSGTRGRRLSQRAAQPRRMTTTAATTVCNGPTPVTGRLHSFIASSLRSGHVRERDGAGGRFGRCLDPSAHQPLAIEPPAELQFRFRRHA
jgi:hypothetical protein